MLGCILREEAFAGGRDEGVPDVGKDFGRAPVGRVEDKADAKFVGGPFEAERDHWKSLSDYRAARCELVLDRK